MAWLEKRGRKTLVVWREPNGSRHSKSFPDALVAELKALAEKWTGVAYDRRSGAYIEQLEKALRWYAERDDVNNYVAVAALSTPEEKETP